MCATVQPRPPPADPGCTYELPPEVLRQIVSEEPVLSQYERLLSMTSDANYRECPKCLAPSTAGPTRHSNQVTSSPYLPRSPYVSPHLPTSPRISTAGPSRHSYQIQCGSCTATYCFVHGDAHPGIGCRQFERKNRAEQAASTATISKFARRCPQKDCRAPIEKKDSDSCNHMTCSVCNTDFCWICGRKITNVELHYSPFNLAGCPGMQVSAPRVPRSPSIATRLPLDCHPRLLIDC